jgi:hypothetical protein
VGEVEGWPSRLRLYFVAMHCAFAISFIRAILREPDPRTGRNVLPIHHRCGSGGHAIRSLLLLLPLVRDGSDAPPHLCLHRRILLPHRASRRNAPVRDRQVSIPAAATAAAPTQLLTLLPLTLTEPHRVQ